MAPTICTINSRKLLTQKHVRQDKWIDLGLDKSDLLLSSLKAICSYRWPPLAHRRSHYMFYDRGDSYPVDGNFKIICRAGQFSIASSRVALV